MTTAFVLSGGGNLGSLQAGMVRALYRQGITPDVIVGTSVGALNGAWLAARGPRADVEELVDVWMSMRRADVFPAEWFGGIKSLVGRRDHLISASGLRRVLHRHLGNLKFADMLIPLHVVATDISTGHDVLLSHGDIIDAVCASAAIPGVFPTVRIDGRTLVDGGVVNNCPISQAIELGASTIYVLPCGYACSLSKPPSGALAIALQAISLLIQHRLLLDFERYRTTTDLKIVPTLCPLNISPTDFTQAGRLIDEADELTTAWIQDPSVGQRPGLHHH